MIDGVNPSLTMPPATVAANGKSSASQPVPAQAGENVPPPPSPKKVDSVNVSAAAQSVSAQSEEASESAAQKAAESASTGASKLNLIA